MKKWLWTICMLIFGYSLLLSTQASPRYKRNVGSFSDMIRYTTGRSVMNYNSYGNYCGFKGKGSPMDNIDICCKEHDRCLSVANNNCPPFYYFAFYTVKLRWAAINKNIICASGTSACKRDMCRCDAECAECFGTHKDEYNNSYKRKLFG